MRIHKLYVVVLLIGLLSISVVSYAFYLNENNYLISLDRDDYDVKINLSFNDVVIDSTSPYFNVEKNAFEINLYDENAQNYIENIELSLDVIVPIASRMRFRLNESYELTRYYHNQDQTILKEIIYMTEKDENYHQFSQLKKGQYTNYIYHIDRYNYIDDLIKTNQTYHFDLIESGMPYPVRDNSLYYETIYLYLSYDIEFIQANRASQVWDIDPAMFT